MVDVRAPDKVVLLKELSTRAAEVAVEPSLISTEIIKREQLGSTGVGSGVAIPHARIPDLNRSFGILARLKKAVDFAAIDGQPVDIVFLLLLPGSPGSEQLNALAAAARQLRKPRVAQNLRKARDGAGAHKAMLVAPVIENDGGVRPTLGLLRCDGRTARNFSVDLGQKSRIWGSPETR
jgi:PTS system nitrogen regulatory IIA component